MSNLKTGLLILSFVLLMLAAWPLVNDRSPFPLVPLGLAAFVAVWLVPG